MKTSALLTGIAKDIATAFQFLTRVPFGQLSCDPDSLSRSAKFFPLVGLLIGIFSASLRWGLYPHLPMMIVALLIVFAGILVTGGLHEDGLADVADGFGGGWNKEQVLAILKDSRIGSYGALAIVFSVAVRVFLLASLPASTFAAYAITAHVLCRWTALPLGFVLPAARIQASLGARLAGHISPSSLITGTLIALAIVAFGLRLKMWEPVLAVAIVTLLSGLYYRRRIGGIMGDCFGATNQLAEIAVYLCGVWIQ